MTIIIPAYKPDQKLISLIDALKAQCDARILVVNDGSGDAFEPIFDAVRAAGCHLLVHPVNRGKGAALKTAFRFLQEEGCDEILCTADADGQHLPKDILACLREAEAHPDALVLGGRGFRGDVPLRSRFGNAASRFTFRLLMGKKVYDTQTGLRAFSTGLLPLMLDIAADRYEYEMQMLCNAVRQKIPVREIEIETVYLEENRSSHFNPVRDALRVYGLLIRCSLGRLYEVISFLFSSLTAVVIDVVVLFLLHQLILSFFMEDYALRYTISLLFARAVSSVVNYLMNRKVVFSNLEKPALTFSLYVLLVVFIYFCNCGVGLLIAKLLGGIITTESLLLLVSDLLGQCVCFPISFFVQKYLIFRKKPKKEEK